jgi:hypothetical protein
MKRTAIMLVLLCPALRAADKVADSDRGAGLFVTLSCIQCHSVNGIGGKVAPDLGRLVDRDFTPATLAAIMWNHAPTMWAAMRERNIQAGDLDERPRQTCSRSSMRRIFSTVPATPRGARDYSHRNIARSVTG